MKSLSALLEQARAYEQNLPPMPPLPAAPAGTAIAGWIDHTLLKPTATADQIHQLCREAQENAFATVCVNPSFVALAADLLRESPVGVCSVISFPLGAHTPQQKAAEARAAIADGAEEIDMVMNIGAMKGGDYQLVYEDIQAVAEACHQAEAHLKVIIENAYLTRYEKILACLISQAAGADYVKTSTGFASSGATVEDVALMRRVVGPRTGVKAAGGIRSWESAQAMIAAGATRIGASSSIKILQEAKNA